MGKGEEAQENAPRYIVSIGKMLFFKLLVLAKFPSNISEAADQTLTLSGWISRPMIWTLTIKPFLHLI